MLNHGHLYVMKVKENKYILRWKAMMIEQEHIVAAGFIMCLITKKIIIM
jgi:hypothetical protein